jgi:hypothetical protein
MTDRASITCAVLLLVLASMARSQTVQTVTVPVAPEPQPQSTPLCQNGAPYQTGATARLVGSCPFDRQVYGPRPDGEIVRDHLWSFGDGERVLHPDKLSWAVCLGMEGGAIASTVWAVQRHKTSHEEAHAEYPVMAVETGLNVLLFKTMSPLMVVGVDAYRMVHYFKAGAH